MPIATDTLLTNVIEREGGFVDHPLDKGGPTKYGITQSTLSSWLDRPATVEDVKALDRSTARAIYRKQFLTDPQIDQLPESIQEQVFDMSVLHGPGRAVKLLQETLGETVDGIIGPRTLEGARKSGPDTGNRLAARRMEFLRGIVANDPTQRVFLRGWLNRAGSFKREITPEPEATELVTSRFGPPVIPTTPFTPREKLGPR